MCARQGELGSVLAGYPACKAQNVGRRRSGCQSGKGSDTFEQRLEGQIPRVSSAHFHRLMEEWKRLIRHYQPLAHFGVKFGVKSERFFRFSPTSSVSSPFTVNNLPIFHFYGMEEVVGSIPTRSTNQEHNYAFCILLENRMITGCAPARFCIYAFTVQEV